MDAISNASGLAKDLIWIVFEDIEPTEWYVGDKSVDIIWKERE